MPFVTQFWNDYLGSIDMSLTDDGVIVISIKTSANDKYETKLNTDDMDKIYKNKSPGDINYHYKLLSEALVEYGYHGKYSDVDIEIKVIDAIISMKDIVITYKYTSISDDFHFRIYLENTAHDQDHKFEVAGVVFHTSLKNEVIKINAVRNDVKYSKEININNFDMLNIFKDIRLNFHLLSGSLFFYRQHFCSKYYNVPINIICHNIYAGSTIKIHFAIEPETAARKFEIELFPDDHAQALLPIKPNNDVVREEIDHLKKKIDHLETLIDSINNKL